LHDEIEVFGAAPAPIHLLRGRWRYRFLLKAERKINIQNYIRQWLCSIQMPKTIRIAVDIDPYSFL
jgi:primosomal protein N' (replication factor Y)